MAHVGVKRLGSGDRQEHRSEREKGELRVDGEELQRPLRAEGDEHLWGAHDIGDAEHREHRHVDEDDGAEETADLGGAPRLDDEQADEDDDRNRDDERLEPGFDDGQALDRREHRDRRGDHRITVEQARRQHAHHHQRRSPLLVAEVAGNQRQQGEGPAFALVVRAHRDEHIFDGHD